MVSYGTGLILPVSLVLAVAVMLNGHRVFGCVEVHRFAGFTYTGCKRPSVAARLNALRLMGLMVPLSFAAWYFDWLEGLFYARWVSDIPSGTVAFLLARNMTAKLPKNSEKTPQTAQNRVLWLFFKRFY